MNTKRKYFGTDGIRGRVGEPPITPEFVMKLGWAAGRVLAQNGAGPVLIGKDTRISGYMFESALEAGLSAAGVDIRLLGPMPTPGIAFLTRNTRAQAGIVISASHNPYQDNGIKFFSGDGTKLPDEIEQAIEDELDHPLEIANSSKLGKVRRITDAPRRYIEFCKSKFNPVINLGGLRLVVDCAHGATYHIAPYVFEELGAAVTSIGTSPDGFNINAESGATNPQKLQEMVIKKGADAGIALDGDGDRIIMVDHKGEVVDGDELLFIIARSKCTSLNGAIVGTVMSNLGLEQAINRLKLDFLRAQVGDRYIMDMLQQERLTLGGETSGHIINLDMTTTGDGIISGLQVLETMVLMNKTLQELKSGMHKYPQKLINVSTGSQVDISRLSAVDKAVKAAQTELGDDGRVLLRPSGTEPLIRVMVEGVDESQVEKLAVYLAREVETAIQRSA
ncbi:MAG: phosphoglucosamine mutase [Gammaproteobacteria bacterium]|nr:phosphoglucosamine mutase [Gammaproteobacteria bacterium]